MTPIHFEAECLAPDCAELARKNHIQLSSGRYSWPASILKLRPMEDHLAEHRTFRKRASRARNLGYQFDEIDRHHYEQDVHAINISAPMRQGRPMSDSYMQPVKYSQLPAYQCARHAIRTYGVLHGSRLVAYTWMYRVGELVLVSQILGHASHLRNDIMYELMRGALSLEWERSGPGYAFYNRHDSGTEGLVYFKERMGFQPTRVAWELQ